MLLDCANLIIRPSKKLVPVAELVVFTPVHCSDHIVEMLHAHVSSWCVSKQAVIEVFLIWLWHFWCISNASSVFVLCVSSPHGINWLFAGKESVRVILEHFEMAELNSDSVVISLPLPVTQKPDFSLRWGNWLILNSKLVLGVLLLAEVQWVQVEVVVVVAWDEWSLFVFWHDI